MREKREKEKKKRLQTSLNQLSGAGLVINSKLILAASISGISYTSTSSTCMYTRLCVCICMHVSWSRLASFFNIVNAAKHIRLNSFKIHAWMLSDRELYQECNECDDPWNSINTYKYSSRLAV